MGRQETKNEYLAKYRYPRNQFRRGFLRGGIAVAVKLILDYKVYGTENLPEKGPLLIVGNHFHFLDTSGPIHTTKSVGVYRRCRNAQRAYEHEGLPAPLANPAHLARNSQPRSHACG